MDDTSRDTQQPECCGDGCDCGGPKPARRSRVKIGISVLVILAAVAVGVYSLAKGRSPDRIAAPPSAATAAKPAAVLTNVVEPIAPVDGLPGCGGEAVPHASDQPSCGCRGANPPVPAQPTCAHARGGTENPLAEGQPSCCGGGATVEDPAAAPLAEPSCGAARPGCCGQH